MRFALLNFPRAIAALIALIALPAWAQGPLTLSEALALAVNRSQIVLANDASIVAAREMAVAAGQLPDPVLKVGIENLPVNGPDRLSLSRDFMTMRRIGLSQELPATLKRQLKMERYAREGERAIAERQLTIANVERDTALAWIEAWYTEQMRDLVLRQARETDVQVKAAQSGYSTGRASQSDVLAALGASVMLEDRISQLDRQGRNAAWMLARWVGTEANRSVGGPAPPWQEVRLDHRPVREHLEYHPDLLMLRAQLETAKVEARLAEAGKRPDWSVEAMYSQRGPAYSNMVSIGVSIPLQVDRPLRQDREVAAKLALVEEARAKYEDMIRHHEAEVRNLVNDWQTGKARVARYREQLVPLARQRSEAALVAYRTGKGDLAATLSARRDEVDALVQALAIEMETARAWAQINFLIPDHGHAAPAAPKEQP